MDKKEYLKIRQELKLQSSTLAWVSYLATDLVLLACLYGLWNWGPPFWKLGGLIPLFSVLMFRNFSFMHEAVHGAISRHKGLNEFLGMWSGCWSVLPYTLWKQSHLEHHYWSGNLEKDPVMALRVVLPKSAPVLLSTLTFFWRAWLPLIGLMQQSLFWLLSFKNTMKKPSWDSFLSLLAPILFWSTLVYFQPKFCLQVVLPAAFLYLLMVEIVNLPHHLQMETKSGEGRYAVWEQYLTARTCLYPKWFAHFIVLNFNYHAEHHMFPDAPWYELPKIHKHLVSISLKNYKTDPNFSWTLENRPKSLLQILETSNAEANSAEKVS